MFNKPIKLTQIKLKPYTISMQNQSEQSRFAAGLSLFQKGRFDEAKNILNNLLSNNPKHLDALHLSGVIYGQLKETKKAITYFQKALKINPSDDELHSNLGNALTDDNQFELAVAHFDYAIKLNTNNFTAFSNRGRALHALSFFDDALTSYNKAIEINKNFAEVYLNRGITLYKINRLTEALSSFKNAINFRNEYAEAFFNCGVVLHALVRYEEAIINYKKAIEIKPYYAEAHHNCGVALKELKLPESSLISYDQAISINTNFFDAYNSRGILHLELKNPVSALENFNKAILIRPESASAHSNRGNALKELKKLEDALKSYDKAIFLKNDYSEAYLNKSVVLKELHRLDEAILNLEIVYELNPNFPFLKGLLLHYMMLVCRWDKFDSLLEEIKSDISNLKNSADPFGLQGVCDDEYLLQRAARIFSDSKFPKNNSPYLKKRINNKIKIGYLCGEFREHATSILMVNLWELHNREKFEVIGLDNGWDDGSEFRNRVLNSLDKVINISCMNDLEVVNLITNENIDILINLNCFFGQQRNTVFSYKPAPIQVNYLGFPGSLGTEYMDYIIADKVVITSTSMKHYSEKIVFLPDSYQANDRDRFVSEKVFQRKDLGLPQSGFIFCCFNNSYKITPTTFDGWMRILHSVENSVLWLLEDNPFATVNLKKQAQIRGISPSRLIFAKRINTAEHLARQKVADLFLDTLPYNAHTTASDALWSGLPLLTRKGSSFAGRVAASLLIALDMTELITETQKEYEATAIDLANNPHKLKFIKDKLMINKFSKPLFNTSRFAQNIEAAYLQMYHRYQNNLPLNHIYIDSN